MVMRRMAALLAVIPAFVAIALGASPAFAESCSVVLRNAPGDTIAVYVKLSTTDVAEVEGRLWITIPDE